MFRRTAAGKCSASIGSLVVVNTDGWILTAGHIVSIATALAQGEQDAFKYYADRQAILDDGALSNGKKKKALKELGTPKKDATHRAAIFWGFADAHLVDVTRLNEVDLAVGRLQPFDPAWVGTYPTFKNPAQDFETGTSLCKYGFPFHDLVPTWNEATDGFDVADDQFPLPFFPIEGLYTRSERPGGGWRPTSISVEICGDVVTRPSRPERRPDF
jgi:hypothetical protein